MASSKSNRPAMPSGLVLATVLGSAVFLVLVPRQQIVPGSFVFVTGAALLLLTSFYLAGALLQFLHRALVVGLWLLLTCGLFISMNGGLPAGRELPKELGSMMSIGGSGWHRENAVADALTRAGRYVGQTWENWRRAG